MSPRGVVIIPIGLIIRLIGGAISVSIRLVGAFFAILLHGTAGQRVYLLLLLCAPVAGFQSVQLLRRFGVGGLTLALPRSTPEPVAQAPIAAPEKSPYAWVTTSANGEAELKQVPAAAGCQLTCLRSGAQVWQVDGECQGRRADLRFVANDCTRSATFITNPAPAAHRRFIDVFLLGRLERSVLDMGLSRDPVALKASHLIAGVLGNPGSPPRYSADGDAVEFSVIDGTETRVPLVPPAPAASTGKPPRKPR